MSLKLQILTCLLLFLCFSCNKKSSEPIPEERAALGVEKGKIIHLSTIANVAGLEETVETVRKAYRKIGYETEIHKMPAQRALFESNSGESIDGELARTLHAQSFLPSLIKIPVRLTSIEASVFTKNTSLEVKSWEDLKDYNVTSVRGYVLIQKKLSHIKGLQEVIDEDQALKFIENGRADLAVLIKKIGLASIKTLELKDIKVLEPPLESIPIYHFIHSKHKDLVPALTKAMKEVTGNEIEK